MAEIDETLANTVEMMAPVVGAVVEALIPFKDEYKVQGAYLRASEDELGIYIVMDNDASENQKEQVRILATEVLRENLLDSNYIHVKYQREVDEAMTNVYDE